jgi:hypothetical protein
MLLSHVIRLRGPWQCTPLARTVLLPNGDTAKEPGNLPPGGRIELPADWSALLGVDFRGRVRFTRRFGLPTGIEPEQRIDLVIEQVDAFGHASLNGQPLGDLTSEPARFQVTRLLKPRNALEVIVELPRLTPESVPLSRPGREHLPGGLIGEVRLEILDSDEFLKAYDLPLPPAAYPD